MNDTAREWIRLETRDAVGILTLAAPDQLNAIHAPMMVQLHEKLEIARTTADIRALILTGEGRAFCSGAHVGEMADLDDKGKGIYRILDNGWNRALRQIKNLPIPVISAVNGIAAGGGVGLALSADIVLAARSATFIQVFGPRLGVIPDVGSTWFLPQALGRARAMRLMLTGEALSATDAEDWGLIARCLEDEALDSEALDLAGRLARGPVGAFAEIRHAVDRGLTSVLSEALDHERDTNARLCAGPDFAEGTRAFTEKREPDFTNSTSKHHGTRS